MKNQLIAFKKKVQDTVQINKAVALARNEIMTVPFIPIQVSEFEGYPIFLHDTYVLACVAIPPEVPGAMFRTDGMIIVNQKFMECPENVRIASLIHELGHLKLKHKAPTLLDKTLYPFGFGGMMEQEYEADKYALEQGTDIVNALYHYLQYDFVAKRPVIKRLEHLYHLMK